MAAAADSSARLATGQHRLNTHVQTPNGRVPIASIFSYSARATRCTIKMRSAAFARGRRSIIEAESNQVISTLDAADVHLPFAGWSTDVFTLFYALYEGIHRRDFLLLFTYLYQYAENLKCS